MPRVVRGYERQDFKDLLNDLHGISPKEEIINTSGPNNDFDKISLAQRKRSSLMDNPKMLYAYSVINRVLHDRNCDLVKDIPNEEFRMSSTFVKRMRICSHCKRNVFIRNGIGDDHRRFQAYLRFFNQLEVSDDELYILIIENGAKLKWISNDVMQIHIKDDTWRVIRTAQGLELWHNNYIRLEDYSRHFIDRFHCQASCELTNFSFLLRIILSYSWDNHIEAFEKSKDAECGGSV